MTGWCSPGRYVHGQEAIDMRLKFLTIKVIFPAQLFLSADFGDGSAQLVIRFNPSSDFLTGHYEKDLCYDVNFGKPYGLC